MKKVMALMALTILTACDRVPWNARTGRDDRLYRSAMEDYRAGRLDAAISGFEESVRNNPANASARFQLACLHQDAKKDFVAAYCGYREFLLASPDSERAGLARDRMAICEKEMAKYLANKHGLFGANGREKNLDAVQAELKEMKNRVAAAEKNLGSAQERVRALSAERDRLLSMVKGAGLERAESVDLRDVRAEKAALEREGPESRGEGGIQSVLMEKKLLEEESEGEIATGSTLVPARKPEDLAKRNKPDPADGKKTAPRQIPEHPKTYVVQEGDTLYGVAKRFYGSITVWKSIRDANKALISSDNRLRVGDTIVLP